MNHLKPKHKEFVKEYLENGNNATQAVKEVFDIKDDNYAGVKGHELLRNTKVQKSIADSIPDELISSKHIALLNKVDENGEIDVNAVKAGVDMGHKVKGSYAPERNLNLNLNVESLDVSNPAVLELMEKLREANENKA